MFAISVTRHDRCVLVLEQQLQDWPPTPNAFSIEAHERTMVNRVVNGAGVAGGFIQNEMSMKSRKEYRECVLQ